MDLETGAGGPGQEERALPPPLKAITANSAVARARTGCVVPARVSSASIAAAVAASSR